MLESNLIYPLFMKYYLWFTCNHYLKIFDYILFYSILVLLYFLSWFWSVLLFLQLFSKLRWDYFFLLLILFSLLKYLTFNVHNLTGFHIINYNFRIFSFHFSQSWLVLVFNFEFHNFTTLVFAKYAFELLVLYGSYWNYIVSISSGTCNQNLI